MGEVIVKRIDISVEGSHLDNLPLSSSSITVDSPAEFLRESSKDLQGWLVEFSRASGETVVSVKFDEGINTLFRVGGKLTHLVSEDQKIKVSDLAQISIQKDEGTKEGDALAGRVRMDSLQIRVNDKLMYSRAGIGMTLPAFTKTHLNLRWYESNLALNETHVAAMQQEDCSIFRD